MCGDLLTLKASVQNNLLQVFRLYSQHFFSFILISAFLASAEFAKPLSVLDMLRVLFEGKKIKMIHNKLFSWVG